MREQHCGRNRGSRLRADPLWLAQAFADVGESAAGEAADAARRRFRWLSARLEIREPGAEFLELVRRQPQNGFFNVFGCHGLWIARGDEQCSVICPCPHSPTQLALHALVKARDADDDALVRAAADRLTL